MKMRANRKRVLARLAHNNKHHWYIWPFMLKAATIRKANERIRAMINERF